MKSLFGCKSLQVAALTALLVAIGAGVFSLPARGDNLYASVKGRVTDSTGAVVGGVKLTATNTATGLSYSTTSNADGVFDFLQVAIGDYTVRAEQTGFKKYQASGIHLDLNQVYNMNVLLAVGAVSEEIIVEANPVQVQQTDIQLGTTVTADQIVNIPLNGRNWTQLQQLQPGVVSTTDRFGGALGGYSGNGAETQQNSFLINGNDSNDTDLNVALVVPSPDSIGEFRMITSTLNPEYGRNSGTIINAAIKNGTNQFHGDGFEFYRDTFMDAGAWFEPGPTPFHQNQFGGTIGGPIIKDHAFFFFSFQGTKNKFPQANVGTSVPVFTMAQRGGAFGAGDLGSNGKVSPFPLFGDSASTCPVSSGTQCAAGTAYSDLFSTGSIPTEDFDPLASKLMNQFIPLPNNGNTFQFNPVTTQKQYQYLYRLDDKLTNADSLWYYQFFQTSPASNTIPFIGATLPGFGSYQTAHTQQYAVSWTHTFSPTTLNEARIGYTRLNYHAVEPSAPINPTTYGFTGITPQTLVGASIPVINVNGLFSLGFSSDGPQPRVQNTYNIVDNFSKVSGHHTIKAGITVELLRIDNPFFASLSGTYTFGGSGAFSTGDQGADFLLGIPDAYNQGSGGTIHGRGKEYYAYVQDQWQVKPNLTLTLGTGYDVEAPWVNNAFGGEVMAAFRPGQQSTVFPSMPTGFVYPGDTGINKYGGMKIHYDNFAPRVGFVWSPKPDWSVHAGVGMYYNRSEEELVLQTLGNPPFSLSTAGVTSQVATTPAFATPFSSVNPAAVGSIPSGSVASPFPYSPPAKGGSFDPAIYAPIGFSTTTYDPRFTSPRSVNFNLTVEHQLSKSTIVSVGYVGNVGRHEEGAYDLNMAGQFPGMNPSAPLYQAPGAPIPCISGLVLNSGLCPQTPLGSAPVPGATPLYLPLYGQTGVQATGYNSKYNSLQASFNRRFSNGLQVLANYTWSRYFDQTSNLEGSAFNFPGINPFDPRDMWAPSQNDAPQRFVVSYTYTLPFYKLVHSWKRLTDGWNLSGIYTLQHGTPVAVFDFAASHTVTCDDFAAFYACPDRANWSAPLKYGNPRGAGNMWITNGPQALTVGAPGTSVGTATRNPFYGPGINYGDMAVEKNINIDEARYFQLRLETYNTFHHANFANPATPGFLNEDAAEPGTFGQIFGVRTLSTNGDGRVMQLGVKFYF